MNGTVAVDVSFESALPLGARPDLSVDGTIEIERLPNILYVGRPVQGQPNSTIGLFRWRAKAPKLPASRSSLGDFGKFRGSAAWIESRRSGDLIRHVCLGFVRPYPSRMTGSQERDK